MLFERLLNEWARPPFGYKRGIGVDGKLRYCCLRSREDKNGQAGCGVRKESGRTVPVSFTLLGVSSL